MSNGLETRIERLMETLAPSKDPIQYVLDLRGLCRLAPRCPIPPEIVQSNREAARALKRGAKLVAIVRWDDRPALAGGMPALSEGEADAPALPSLSLDRIRRQE